LEAELSSRTKEASKRRLSCGSERGASSCCWETLSWEIERSLLRNALSREDGCLSDIELQASIFFEDGLKLSQDLKGHR
jgi:hypothetical protein